MNDRPSLNSHQFPQVYKKLGITVSDLGCIMLDVEPFDIVSLVENGENDLFYGDIPDLKYAQGAVAEESAHVTLLYGLLESGQKWKSQVDAVLDGWNPPLLSVESVGFFPSNIEGQDYSAIIGHIEVTDALLEGNQRLQLLPHVNTFPGYKPHVTLAYIKNGPSGVEWTDTARNKWIETLQKEFKGKTFRVTRINYGDD